VAEMEEKETINLTLEKQDCDFLNLFAKISEKDLDLILVSIIHSDIIRIKEELGSLF
jgi:hypothetical protein